MAKLLALCLAAAAASSEIGGSKPLFPDGACGEDGDCKLDEFCNYDRPYCEINGQLGVSSETWFYDPDWFEDAAPLPGPGNLTTDNVVLRCPWVGEEDPRVPGTGGPAGETTRKRCLLEGVEPTVGCSNGVGLFNPRCNYTLVLRSIPAFAACCNECRWGVCQLADDDTTTKTERLFSLWIEVICAVGCMLAVLSCLVRSCCRPDAQWYAGQEKPDDSAVERAGLVDEIDREQRFTIRCVDLFRNRLETKRDVEPPARAPPVPERPGMFAEIDGVFARGAWPGGVGVKARPRYVIAGFIRFMWVAKQAEKGQWACLKLIAFQAFLLTYPSISAFYVSLIFNQAAGTGNEAWGLGIDDKRQRLRLVLLIFTGYISIFFLDLWVQWNFWIICGLGRMREHFRNALLLKVLRLPKKDRPSPGQVAGVLLPRVDDVVTLWYSFLKMCGVPAAMTFQIIVIGSSGGSAQTSYMVFGPLLIFSGCLIALRRHKKTMFESASQCVNSQNHLYAALEEQAAKPRFDSDSTLKEARDDTETFAVANFVYRRRHALMFHVNLQAVFEQSTYGHIVICFALMAAGLSVMSNEKDSLGPGDLYVIFQMLNEIEVTARTVARIVVEIPQYHEAVMLLAELLNADDLGVGLLAGEETKEDREEDFFGRRRRVESGPGVSISACPIASPPTRVEGSKPHNRPRGPSDHALLQADLGESPRLARAAGPGGRGAG